MKKLLFIAAFTALSFAGLAQEESTGGVRGFKFGAGVNLAIPIGDWSDIYSIGAGLDLLAQYGLSDKFAVTADVGYTSVFVKSDFKDLFESQGIIPIRVGVRFFATPQLYIAGKGGIGIFTGSEDVLGNKNSVTTTAYSFGAGYMMSRNLEVGAAYNGFSKDGNSNGLIGIRVGYFFGQ